MQYWANTSFNKHMKTENMMYSESHLGLTES